MFIIGDWRHVEKCYGDERVIECTITRLSDVMKAVHVNSFMNLMMADQE